MAAKQKGVLDGLMDALGVEGEEIFQDVVEGLLGGDGSALGELLGSGEGLMEEIGDWVSDLTGIGASNTKASSAAKKTGVTKSSTSGKKTIKSTAAKEKSAKTKMAKTQPKANTATKAKSSSAKKKIIT